MTIDEAKRAVNRAEQKLSEARATRIDALNRLDEALAGRGWRRFPGAFGPEVRLYVQPGGNPVHLNEVLAHERSVA